jgi:hypothetical protein
MTPAIVLTSPLDYQVIQRRSLRDGIIPITGSCEPPCERVEVRLTGKTMDGSPYTMNWLAADLDPATGSFRMDLAAPVGGWYALHVRTVKGSRNVISVRIPHVGVGEVFVGAGQSNSTSCGGVGSTSRLDGRTKTLTRRVSTFDGSRWRIADDPQPGAHDSHDRGSFWPAFGDSMATRYGVPIGVAVTGHAGTSLRQLGPHGFRALLWHQGENDADTGMITKSYTDALADLITGLRSEVDRDFPFFVAQSSFIPWPKDSVSPDIRAAQQLLWARGTALEGPDTDAMRGDLRDCGGMGIHFSKKGLKIHGEAWAEKVATWLDPIVTLLIILTAVLACVLAPPAMAAEFHIAPTGGDNNPGTRTPSAPNHLTTR